LRRALARGESRLLVLDAEGEARHRHVADLPALLGPGDLLVVNDTRVIPARLLARRAPGGARVELLLVERDETGWFTALPGGAHRWPHDVFATSGRLRVASVEALSGYREAIAARRARAA